MNYYHDKSLENGELEQERSYEIKVLRIKGRKIDIEVQYVFQWFKYRNMIIWNDLLGHLKTKGNPKV